MTKALGIGAKLCGLMVPDVSPYVRSPGPGLAGGRPCSHDPAGFRYIIIPLNQQLVTGVRTMVPGLLGGYANNVRCR